MYVICLNAEDTDVETDDPFILKDVLNKNINLIPIRQEFNYEKHNNDQDIIYLYKFNDTDQVMYIKAYDMQIGVKKNKKRGSAESDVLDEKDDLASLDELDNSIGKITKQEYKNIHDSKAKISHIIPNSNIIIAKLNPGKFLKIKKLNFLKGQSKINAAKFSLLTNIIYKPIDIKPYNIKEKTGTRSIEYDCNVFYMQLLTAGNIQPKTLFKNLNEYIKNRLENIKEKIEKYSIVEKNNINEYYYDGLEVSYNGVYKIYTFEKEYISYLAMIAQKCYLLDTHIEFVSSTVERYDSEKGIIKIIHPESNKILIKASDECIADINYVCEQLQQTKIVSK
jgi:hypothetical protein